MNEKEKPIPEKYGWHNQSGFSDEPSGWMIDGGEEAYYKDLKEWEEEQVKKQLLFDFFIWFLENGEKNMDKSIESIIDIYLQEPIKNNIREILSKLLTWMKDEPEFNIDDIDEILDDYEYYQSNDN